MLSSFVPVTEENYRDQGCYQLPARGRLLIRETEKAALAELSEDELIELHTRIRRARSKYVKNYRRGASARVRPIGGRGRAGQQGARDRDRAEVFEQALARVSAALSRAARHSAAELRSERIAAAQAAKSGVGPSASAGRESGAGKGGAGAANARRGDRNLVSPRSLKKGASSAAAGGRRQAAKDSRHS